MNKETTKETDWKVIAMKLMRQCEFALSRLKADGWTGELLEWKGEECVTRHWKEEMADAMELIPGLKVNREAMYETRKKRKK